MSEYPLGADSQQELRALAMCGDPRAVRIIEEENRRWERERALNVERVAKETTSIHSGRPLYDDLPKEKR